MAMFEDWTTNYLSNHELDRTHQDKLNFPSEQTIQLDTVRNGTI